MSTAKRSYATLDVRTVLAKGLPSPQRMPVLILSATGLRNYAWLKVGDLNAKLQTYLDAGGRVLWIGGDAKPPAALAPIATALTRTEKQPLPFPPDQFRQWHLAMVGDHDNTSWSFVRSPSQKVGWSQPLCPWSFNKLASAELKPLLQLQRDGTKLTVAVLWTTADGKSLKGAYLPIYCLAPHLLTQTDLLTTPTQPALDQPGETILFDTLDRLTSAKSSTRLSALTAGP